MGYNNPDVYYNPEKFDLEIVEDLDLADAPYEFDMAVVWQHKDGSYYVAEDSGCSCPSPFERHTSLDDLEGPMSKQSVIAWIESLEPYNKKDFEPHRVAAIERMVSR